MLHPVRGGPARNHDAGGKTVPVRQLFPVHLQCHQGVFVHRLPCRNALYEIRCLVDHTPVGAIEYDLERVFPHAGSGQQIAQSYAAPPGIADRAVAPLHAGHMRQRQPAPVARAHAYCRDFDLFEVSGQFLVGDLERLVQRVPCNGEFPVLQAHLRNVGKVVAHEKRFVRRERLVEKTHRGFEIRRPEGFLDQRQLAR